MRRRLVRRFMVAAVGLAVIAALPACQAGRVGTRCRPNGEWGHDSTYVLHCEGGRWHRSITIAAWAQIVLSHATTTAAPTTTTAAPTTTTTTPPKVIDNIRLTTYGLDVPDYTGPIPMDWEPLDAEFREPALGAIDCDPDPATGQVQATLDGTTLHIVLGLGWMDHVSNTPEGRIQCVAVAELHVELFDSISPDATDLGAFTLNLISDQGALPPSIP
jgi:hypothetical protein